MFELDAAYWENRYQEDNIPWDAGAVTQALKAYVDQLESRDLKILIPGCGTGHEAAYLYEQGFENVFVCDWSVSALRRFAERVPSFPAEQLICEDFFKLGGTYDLILEQTFFCAIDPSLRSHYVEQSARLLKANAKLVGLFFGIEFPFEGPPFGGTETLYRSCFETYFQIEIMEKAYNSIKPRSGNELFVKMRRRSNIAIP